MMVGAQAAYFQTYTAVDGGGAHGAPDQLEFNATGEPLLSTTGAVASTTLLDQYISAADSTHWILGPFASTTSAIRFSVAGGGAPATVSFSFEVQGAWDLGLSKEHNASGGFGLELSGVGSDSVGGAFNDVNCIGCGGHIGYSTLSLHGAPTTITDNWDGQWRGAYTLTTTVESGRPDAGLINVYASTNLGSTHGSLRIRLTSLSLDGQAASLVNNGAAGWSVSAVPEPTSLGLAMAGILVVGALQRRRQISV
jgi:hypothetical protein